MSVTFTPRIDVSLTGNDYASPVSADAPLGRWKLDENGTTATDYGSGGNPGTYSGNYTQRQSGPVVDGVSYGTKFDGSGGTARVAIGGLLNPWSGDFTIEAWALVRDTSQSVGGVLGKEVYLTNGFRLGAAADCTLWQFWTTESGGGINIQSAANSLVLNRWTLLTVTRSGSTFTFYVNGASVGTSSAAYVAPGGGFEIGGAIMGWTLNGSVAQVAVYSTALSAARVLAHYQSYWTSLGNDVLQPVSATLGISGNSPTDVAANPGELHFELDNSASNSGATLGWYSPAGATKRSGWTFGIPVRWVFTYSSVEYVRFRGKIGVINPVPGQKFSRRVSVVAYDIIDDLATADARQVTVQTSKNEAQLLASVLAALPSTAQPAATSYDTGLDTSSYAFNNVGQGTAAASLLHDIVLSSLGLLFVAGDGTLKYLNRQSITKLASSLTFSDDMIGLVVPSTLAGIFNRVRTTIHPKTVDAAPTTVLYSMTGSAMKIPAGSVVTIWGAYRDPSAALSTQTLIGGFNTVLPLVATTDYTANAAADGSGANKTSSLSIATTAFASTAKFVITNTDAYNDVWLTALQIRGEGIYDQGPRTFEHYTAMAYGDRPVDIDLPYQESADFGANAAAFVDAQYNSLTSRVESVQYVAGASSTFALAAMQLDVGALVTLTESVTGLAASTAVINSVRLDWKSNDLRVTYGLRPASPYAVWRLGVAGFSEIGKTTRLGI